jgi:hypothetical protein
MLSSIICGISTSIRKPGSLGYGGKTKLIIDQSICASTRMTLACFA